MTIQLITFDLDDTLLELGANSTKVWQVLTQRHAAELVLHVGQVLVQKRHQASQFAAAKRRIVALTDMLELGPDERAFHAGLAAPLVGTAGATSANDVPECAKLYIKACVAHAIDNPSQPNPPRSLASLLDSIRLY